MLVKLELKYVRPEILEAAPEKCAPQPGKSITWAKLLQASRFFAPPSNSSKFSTERNLATKPFFPFLQLITEKIERGRRFVLHNKPSFAAVVNGVGRPRVGWLEKRKMMVNIIIFVLKRFCTERKRRFSVAFRTSCKENAPKPNDEGRWRENSNIARASFPLRYRKGHFLPFVLQSNFDWRCPWMKQWKREADSCGCSGKFGRFPFLIGNSWFFSFRRNSIVEF